MLAGRHAVGEMKEGWMKRLTDKIWAHLCFISSGACRCAGDHPSISDRASPSHKGREQNADDATSTTGHSPTGKHNCLLVEDLGKPLVQPPEPGTTVHLSSLVSSQSLTHPALVSISFTARVYLSPLGAAAITLAAVNHHHIRPCWHVP